eukprot:gene15227-biopygen14249
MLGGTPGEGGGLVNFYPPGGKTGRPQENTGTGFQKYDAPTRRKHWDEFPKNADRGELADLKGNVELAYYAPPPLSQVLRLPDPVLPEESPEIPDPEAARAGAEGSGWRSSTVACLKKLGLWLGHWGGARAPQWAQHAPYNTRPPPE